LFLPLLITSPFITAVTDKRKSKKKKKKKEKKEKKKTEEKM
jgi:hypothetical protein